MIVNTFSYGPYQVKIHKSRTARSWAYRVSLNDRKLEAGWQSAQSAAAYARGLIDGRS